MAETSSPGTLAAPEVTPLTGGIMSGPGNQGTANTAQLQGHAGTGAGFLAIPRQLKGGAWGSKPQ